MLLLSHDSWANNKYEVTFARKLESRTNETKIPSRQKATPKLAGLLVSLTTDPFFQGLNQSNKQMPFFMLPAQGETLLSARESACHPTMQRAAVSFPLTARPPIKEVLMKSGFRKETDFSWISGVFYKKKALIKLLKMHALLQSRNRS